MVLARCEGDGATEGAVAGNAKLLPGWVEFDPCDPCVILWYLLVNILATSVCPVPIAGAMTAISAVLFGLVPGMAITTTSSLIGAYLGHLAVRHLCRPCLMRSLGRYHEHWLALDAAISQAGATQIALLMRLSPMFPMVGNNILLSLTSISTWTYMWTCAAGVIPSNLPYAYAAELGVSLHNHEEPLMVMMTVLGLLVSVAFAWKLGVIAKQLLLLHGVGALGERPHASAHHGAEASAEPLAHGERPMSTGCLGFLPKGAVPGDQFLHITICNQNRAGVAPLTPTQVRG